MSYYFQTKTPLQPIEEDANYESIYRQASDAFERLFAQQDGNQTELSLLAEPTDHEGEGAMLYIISRYR
jgi:hypothetical protein